MTPSGRSPVNRSSSGVGACVVSCVRMKVSALKTKGHSSAGILAAKELLSWLLWVNRASRLRSTTSLHQSL